MIVARKGLLYEFSFHVSKQGEVVSVAECKTRQVRKWLLLITSCAWPIEGASIYDLFSH